MTSFRGQGNKKGKGRGTSGRTNSGSGYTRPKIPKGKSKPEKTEKSPLIVHFFFWTVLLSSFIAIFGTFQQQIHDVVLWYDFYTLFGAITYWDATIGWTITIMMAMCLDMIRVANRK